MKCKLCLLERDLRKSHIIPEFLYRPAYDEKHRYAALRQDKNGLDLIQKGFYEPLLCADCEQLLGRYESYFAHLWYRSSQRLPLSTRREFIHLTGLDYGRFKLFHLSILWRASVSSRGEFSTASLGSHENEIRNMLLIANPKTQSDYPITGVVILKPSSRRIVLPNPF